jgi:antitoxin PrlF
MSTFTGSITTTGKSQAIRLDKTLFRLHPEFRQKAKVRAQVIFPWSGSHLGHR